MTKLKICGLSRPCDVQFVNEAKPDYCGFVVNFPRSGRSVSPDQVRRLVRDLDPGILPVGVFVDQPPEAVAALVNDGTLALAQLHGHEDEGYLQALRRLTVKPILQAFQVKGEGALARAAVSSADLLLLDSGQGSGETFDWSLVKKLDRPFFLAGGLTPENLPAAVRQVRPYAVDLSSGVETDGRKDKNKILAAVAAVRGA